MAVVQLSTDDNTRLITLTPAAGDLGTVGRYGPSGAYPPATQDGWKSSYCVVAYDFTNPQYNRYEVFLRFNTSSIPLDSTKLSVVTLAPVFYNNQQVHPIYADWRDLGHWPPVDADLTSSVVGAAGIFSAGFTVPMTLNTTINDLKRTIGGSGSYAFLHLYMDYRTRREVPNRIWMYDNRNGHLDLPVLNVSYSKQETLIFVTASKPQLIKGLVPLSGDSAVALTADATLKASYQFKASGDIAVDAEAYLQVDRTMKSNPAINMTASGDLSVSHVLASDANLSILGEAGIAPVVKVASDPQISIDVEAELSVMLNLDSDSTVGLDANSTLTQTINLSGNSTVSVAIQQVIVIDFPIKKYMIPDAQFRVFAPF